MPHDRCVCVPIADAKLHLSQDQGADGGHSFDGGDGPGQVEGQDGEAVEHVGGPLLGYPKVCSRA